MESLNKYRYGSGVNKIGLKYVGIVDTNVNIVGNWEMWNIHRCDIAVIGYK